MKFAAGFLAGAGGSKALSSGFRAMKERPELKQAVIDELAHTLSKGWESASAKYPALQALEPPRHIIKSEKGRQVQAKAMINKAEQNMLEYGKNSGDKVSIKNHITLENKINYKYLQEISQDIPEPISKEKFLSIFNNKKYANIQTPMKELEIEPLKAYEHLLQNSNNQNRIDISGVILPTLQNPLFISKDKKGTYYFYKPFKDSRGVLNIVSITIPKSNRIRYKTSYIASRQRMLKMINEYEIVYEAK